MVHIVTVSTSKGGAGKTSTTVGLADYWSKRGLRVGLIDTDPTRSLARWIEKGRDKGGFAEINFRHEPDDKKIIATARELAQESDVLLIDVAGIASVSLLKAAGIADLVIIPAQPNEDDFLEAINTRNIVREAMELTGRSVSCKTVITRARPGTVVLKHILSQLEKLKFPLFSTVLYERTVFPQARFMGQTPISFAPGSEGAKNIEEFGDEVMGLLTSLRTKKETQQDNPKTDIAA